MPYKTILLHCNDRRRIEPLLAATVTLAERFQAHALSLSIVPPVAIIATHAWVLNSRRYPLTATRDRVLSAEWREDEARTFGVAKRVMQYRAAFIAYLSDPSSKATAALPKKAAWR
jgi:hypothetical protein